MNYISWLLLLSIFFYACESPQKPTITLDDINKSSNRATISLQEDKISFFDQSENEISPDGFNQLLAEGIYLSEQKIHIDGYEEMHLISIDEHAKRLKNQPLPDFQLKDLNGNIYTEESFKGKVTVLSFWFTASSICTTEIDEINNLVKKNTSNKKLLWLAPALDRTTDLSRFLKDKGWEYDFAANQENLALKFGILTYPTHLIIDQNGEIAKVVIRHPKPKDVIEKTIKALL